MFPGICHDSPSQHTYIYIYVYKLCILHPIRLRQCIYRYSPWSYISCLVGSLIWFAAGSWRAPSKVDWEPLPTAWPEIELRLMNWHGRSTRLSLRSRSCDRPTDIGSTAWWPARNDIPSNSNGPGASRKTMHGWPSTSLPRWRPPI